MKTLKRIIAGKGKIAHAVNTIYMTENDYIECFKEWLQQKQKSVSQISMRHEVYKELLEELKNE